MAMNIRSALRKSQTGAAAIEAALMFVIFFTLFYAIVSYSLPMLMVQSFNHAAATGARAAVAIEPTAFSDTDSYIQDGVIPRVRQVVGSSLAWLPQTASDAVLGENNGNVDVVFDPVTGVLAVTVTYSGYQEAPMIPSLTLPGIGTVPKLPADLQGTANVTL